MGILCVGVIYGVYGVVQLFIPFKGVGSQSIVILPGDRISTIAKNMVSAGLVRDAFTTELYLRILSLTATVKAGNYSIEPGSNGIVTGLLFLRGIPREEKTLRIIEGWSIAQVADYLKNQGFQSSGVILQNTLNDWGGQLPFFKNMPRGASLEGFYFPDTYRVFADTQTEDVTQKALSNFEKKVMPIMPAEISGEKIYEIVTLASIVEKEVSTDEDRAMVADIFQRRIKTGMPLQSDATVNYVTGKNMLQATLEDTRVNSAYNTYRVQGLPPGPICNPGLSSIRAVLYPKANDYLFFLTTKDERVIYSKTFDEHVKNKQRYL